MIYQFNGIEIDVSCYEIRTVGKVVSAEPKVFDLILYLIENRERTVSRDELFEHVWQGRNVSDTTLSNHIKSARKILGDDGSAQRVIKTIRSRGYQFIAAVETIERATVAENEEHPLAKKNAVISENSTKANLFSRTHSVKWFLIVMPILLISMVFWQLSNQLPSTSNNSKTAGLTEPLVDSPSLASQPYLLVTPLSISSENAITLAPFTDQLSRELIQSLRKISGLKVVPPPSAFSFSNDKTRAHIRRQLPTVNYVLDGIVSENTIGKLRVSVELEHLSSGKVLWDGNFDIQPDNQNLFEVQEEIATLVSKSLKVVILDDEKGQLSQAPTGNSDAYQLYVQGRYLLSQMTRQSVTQSIEYFSQAITLDPNFIEAYISKSNAYRTLMIYFEKPIDVLPKTISSAIDVLTIAPNSAQMMSSLGLAYVHAFLWEDAWKMLNNAHSKNPNMALNELGFALFYSAMGNIDAMKRSLKRANSLDPINTEIAEWGMWALMMNNQIDDAIKWGNEKLALHPNVPYPLLSLAVAKVINNENDAAIALARKAVFISNREPYALIILAQVYAASGNFDSARSLIDEVNGQEQYVCPYETAVAYAYMKETKTAYSLLDQALDAQSNCLIFLRGDPRLMNIRNDERFQKLLTEIGLSDSKIQRLNQAKSD